MKRTHCRSKDAHSQGRVIIRIVRAERPDILEKGVMYIVYRCVRRKQRIYLVQRIPPAEDILRLAVLDRLPVKIIRYPVNGSVQAVPLDNRIIITVPGFAADENPCFNPAVIPGGRNELRCHGITDPDLSFADIVSVFVFRNLDPFLQRTAAQGESLFKQITESRSEPVLLQHFLKIFVQRILFRCGRHTDRD